MTSDYYKQTQIDQTLRLREVLKTLPPFAKDYFRAMEPKSSAKTRINYAYDIRVFFHFLLENNPIYKNYTMDQFRVQDLERIEPDVYKRQLSYDRTSGNESFRKDCIYCRLYGAGAQRSAQYDGCETFGI